MQKGQSKRKSSKKYRPQSEKDFSAKSLTDFPPFDSIFSCDSLIFDFNPIQNFETLPILINLKSLSLNGTKISNLEFAQKQPNLEFLSFQNTPFSQLKFCREMCLIVFSDKLEYINGKRVRSKERNFIQSQNLSKVKSLLFEGWIIRQIEPELEMENQKAHVIAKIDEIFTSEENAELFKNDKNIIIIGDVSRYYDDFNGQIIDSPKNMKNSDQNNPQNSSKESSGKTSKPTKMIRYVKKNIFDKDNQILQRLLESEMTGESQNTQKDIELKKTFYESILDDKYDKEMAKKLDNEKKNGPDSESIIEINAQNQQESSLYGDKQSLNLNLISSESYHPNSYDPKNKKYHQNDNEDDKSHKSFEVEDNENDSVLHDRINNKEIPEIDANNYNASSTNKNENSKSNEYNLVKSTKVHMKKKVRINPNVRFENDTKNQEAVKEETPKEEDLPETNKKSDDESSDFINATSSSSFASLNYSSTASDTYQKPQSSSSNPKKLPKKSSKTITETTIQKEKTKEQKQTEDIPKNIPKTKQENNINETNKDQIKPTKLGLQKNLLNLTILDTKTEDQKQEQPTENKNDTAKKESPTKKRRVKKTKENKQIDNNKESPTKIKLFKKTIQKQPSDFNFMNEHQDSNEGTTCEGNDDDPELDDIKAQPIENLSESSQGKNTQQSKKCTTTHPLDILNQQLDANRQQKLKEYFHGDKENNIEQKDTLQEKEKQKTSKHQSNSSLPLPPPEVLKDNKEISKPKKHKHKHHKKESQKTSQNNDDNYQNEVLNSPKTLSREIEIKGNKTKTIDSNIDKSKCDVVKINPQETQIEQHKSTNEIEPTKNNSEVSKEQMNKTTKQNGDVDSLNAITTPIIKKHKHRHSHHPKPDENKENEDNNNTKQIQNSEKLQERESTQNQNAKLSQSNEKVPQNTETKHKHKHKHRKSVNSEQTKETIPQTYDEHNFKQNTPIHDDINNNASPKTIDEKSSKHHHHHHRNHTQDDSPKAYDDKLLISNESSTNEANRKANENKHKHRRQPKTQDPQADATPLSIQSKPEVTPSTSKNKRSKSISSNTDETPKKDQKDKNESPNSNEKKHKHKHKMSDISTPSVGNAKQNNTKDKESQNDSLSSPDKPIQNIENDMENSSDNQRIEMNKIHNDHQENSEIIENEIRKDENEEKHEYENHSKDEEIEIEGNIILNWNTYGRKNLDVPSNTFDQNPDSLKLKVPFMPPKRNKKDFPSIMTFTSVPDFVVTDTSVTDTQSTATTTIQDDSDVYVAEIPGITADFGASSTSESESNTVYKSPGIFNQNEDEEIENTPPKQFKIQPFKQEFSVISSSYQPFIRKI